MHEEPGLFFFRDGLCPFFMKRGSNKLQPDHDRVTVASSQCTLRGHLDYWIQSLNITWRTDVATKEIQEPTVARNLPKPNPSPL